MLQFRKYSVLSQRWVCESNVHMTVIYRYNIAADVMYSVKQGWAAITIWACNNYNIRVIFLWHDITILSHLQGSLSFKNSFYKHVYIYIYIRCLIVRLSGSSALNLSLWLWASVPLPVWLSSSSVEWCWCCMNVGHWLTESSCNITAQLLKSTMSFIALLTNTRLIKLQQCFSGDAIRLKHCCIHQLFHLNTDARCFHVLCSVAYTHFTRLRLGGKQPPSLFHRNPSSGCVLRAVISLC